MALIDPQTLLEAYAQGVFPMAESRHASDVDWFTAIKRGIIPLNGFKISNNVRQRMNRERYKVRVNTQFRLVMEKCAAREETWINGTIVDSYVKLNETGFAHSLEIYSGGELTGGLYGVQLGAAFFGESMFRTSPDHDKIALFHCHERLVAGGFQLWDTQMWTPHLAQFGCIEISQEDYLVKLSEATQKTAKF